MTSPTTVSATVFDAAEVAWKAGLTLTAIGEAITAFDPKRGNTISEKFDRLPLPAKFAIVLAIGAVLGHWLWPMPKQEDSPTTTSPTT